jgi:hypothetical protein
MWPLNSAWIMASFHVAVSPEATFVAKNHPGEMAASASLFAASRSRSISESARCQ